MSAPDVSGRPHVERGGDDLRRAWIWVLLVPVAMVVAMVVGEGAIGALGYPVGGDETAPLWAVLLVGVPATLLALAPGVMAARHGLRAHRAGRRRALVPAVIGALVVAYWVITGVAGLAMR